jgi:ankyrin repeat protein
VLPLFRTGCWKSIRLLLVERGKGNEYEGRTAEDMVVILKFRKVQKEIDTYTVWEKSLNLIHVEARIGNFAGVKHWLEYSSDLHTELDSMQCSTLYWACIGGNLDIVKLLLLLKVDFTIVNTRKETLLHAACMMGHHQLIEILVKECQMDLNAKDAAKKTPLLRVSENGDEKCLAKLLDCGMRTEQLGPMLAIAGHYGRIGLIRLVVEKYGVSPQSKDEAGKSAVLRSAEQGRIDVLKYLFTKAVDFEETDIRRRNILHLAADGASKEVVQFIIEELQKKKIDVKKLMNARDKYVGGELCMLIRGKDKGRDSWHYVEVSRSLMDIFLKKTRGGTIDVAKYGTLLHSGWGADPDEVAAREIERRFETRRNVNTADDADSTPLHIAAFKDKLDVAEVLLDNGADPNIRDKFGMTAMHIAAMRGNLTLIQKLVSCGATADALDTMIKTPADVAEDNEHSHVCNYLKGVKYLPIAQRFRETILPNIDRLLSPEHIQSIHAAGGDLRTHLINTLRDLTIDVNGTLLELGSGPVLEESTLRQF